MGKWLRIIQNQWMAQSCSRRSGIPSRVSVKKSHPEQHRTVSENKNGEKLKSGQCWRSGYLLSSKEHQQVKITEVKREWMIPSSCWKKTTVNLKFCIYLKDSSEMNKKLKIFKKIIMSTSVLKEILESILWAEGKLSQIKAQR